MKYNKLIQSLFTLSIFISFFSACIPPIDTDLADATLLLRILRRFQINEYTISGTISGLTKSRFVIQTKDLRELSIQAGTLNYQIKVIEGSTNPLRFKNQPIGLFCSFQKEILSITKDETDVNIHCQALGGLSIGLLDTFYSVCYNAGSIIACNNSSFPAQDGDTGSVLTQSFIDNLDGTITDQNTGLTWRKCVTGYSGATCSLGTLIQSSYSTSLANCSGDFRLPTIKELATLNRYGHPTSKIDPIFPNYDTTRFRWSRSVSPIDGVVYSKQFDIDNRIRNENPSLIGTTHCVKNAPILDESFEDLNNGIIMDSKIGLEWQKCHLGQDPLTCSGTPTPFTSWELALNYCNDLNLGSKSDWRLPNIHELTSLIIFSNTNLNRIDPLFTNIDISRRYLSSSTELSAFATVRSINLDTTSSAVSTLMAKSVIDARVKCVRGPNL